MAQILSSQYSKDLYNPWLSKIQTIGEEVNPRGRHTLEILNAVTEVIEPWHHCILIPARRWNPWIAMSESLWILAGRDDVEALKPYNSHIVDYSDDGEHLYGAYGPRIAPQIDDVVARLRNDNDDRRAVIQIWNTPDLTAFTKDPPCNDMIMFKVRRNKLHMTVICRSNDLHFGLFAVNLPTFGLLQVYLASRLNVGVGNQTHISDSLHIYTDDNRAVAITERMNKERYEKLPVYPDHDFAFYAGELKNTNHSKIQYMASCVLDGVITGDSLPLFFTFASRFLATYKEKDVKALDNLEQFGEYQDWINAGRIFGNEVWK